ncbi:MAG: sulfite exporter TauE/SafE family protein, partial [Amphiplicatus sp.]
RAVGAAETFVTAAYVIFLGLIGTLMLTESISSILRQPRAGARKRRRARTAWMAALPGPIRFRRSQLYISPIPPLFFGFVVGVLGAMLGVGGGFFMVPVMIYILQMPTSVVVGTSLFQITIVTAVTTVLHAAANQTVDIVLALILIVGGVVGAQLGARVGVLLKAEQLRALLALVVLAVGVRLGFDLILPPAEPFVVEEM